MLLQVQLHVLRVLLVHTLPLVQEVVHLALLVPTRVPLDQRLVLLVVLELTPRLERRPVLIVLLVHILVRPVQRHVPHVQ